MGVSGLIEWDLASGLCSATTIFPSLSCLQVTKQGLLCLHRGLFTSCSLPCNPPSLPHSLWSPTHLSTRHLCDRLCEVHWYICPGRVWAILSVGLPVQSITSVITQEILFFLPFTDTYLYLSANRKSLKDRN